MEQFINQIITKTKERYSDDYSYMLSDFNQESETAKGYNGRQFLELLQNCDDQTCKRVCVELDEENGTIAIHNDGIPFSENGYRSLFIPYLSSKTSYQKFIGNKGLGFRSVITWSKAIEIHSNSLSLIYSDENRRINFDTLYSIEQQQEIREKENIRDNVIPIPFLTLPVVKSVVQDEFVTSIIITYKSKYLEDIKQQLDAITPETILFLTHIESIDFKGIEGKDKIVCNRKEINKVKRNFSPHTQIDFDDSSWRIFEKEEVLPVEFSDTSKKDEEVYQIKVAVEKAFKLTSPFLYSFFPTKIRLKQPYILHATFDLDPTRNEINDSEKNRFILKRIVEFTVEVAKFFTKRKVSYRPLKILHHEHEADTLVSLGYYDLIDKAIESEPIFPCIDNTYKTKEECIYANDSFAQMLQDIGAERHLTIHLITRGEFTQKFVDNFGVDNKLSQLTNVTDVFNNISRLKLSHCQRAKFIYELTQSAQFIKDDFPDQLALLTNENGKLIKGSEYIYTPITKGKKLKTPSFANIQFLNQELFDELIAVFDFESDDSKDRGRFIAEKLYGFCNVRSYEPATLAKKIVSETNRAVFKDGINAIEFIKEMNECLFHNFQFLNDTTKLPSTISVPILTQNEEISIASDLVLSDEYPTGKHTQLIFKEIYSKKDFVGSLEKLGLEKFEVDANELERYLVWLGVNKYAKYQYQENVSSGLSNYVKNVLHDSNTHDWSSYSLNYKSIDGIEDILNNISIENLIVWIYLDNELRISIDDSDNDDFFSYFYYSNKHLYKKQSFIKYMILQCHAFDFKNYLIDDKYSWVNQHPINYNHELFRNLNITKTEINEILIKLGAKDDFLNLSVKRVAEILNLLPEKYPNGSKSQTVYKKALSHYAMHREELGSGVQLFANDGSGLKLFSQEEVYFNDRIKLPKRLFQDFPIFNFPSRAGGSEAIKFFGIKDLKEIHISIEDYEVQEEISISFNRYLIELKPLILAHRINEIDELKQQRSSASICNQLEIVLCTRLMFKVNEQFYELSDYEYIYKGGYTYYIKINPYDSINGLRRNVVFTQSFADIISISFNVFGERNEFKYMLRSDLEDVKLSVIEEYGSDNYIESRNLLGLADHKQAFWEAIFISKGIEHDHNLDDVALESKIEKELNVSFVVSELEYNNLNRKDELIKIQDLFLALNLNLESFNENFISEISLEEIHFEVIKNEILKYKPKLKIAIWHDLKEKDISDQEEFLELVDKMERFHDFVELKSYDLRYEFEINALAIAQQYVQERYGQLEYGISADLVEIRKINSDSFSSEELDIINGSVKFKSLLYFTSALAELKKRLKVNNRLKVDEIKGVDPEYELVLVRDKILVPTNGQPSKKKFKRGVYTPSHEEGKKKKQKGDSLEELVFNYMLQNQYENVDWVSRDNEGLHCDIRYTGDDDKIKYVEVKAFDGGYFYLSRDEYEFGKSEQANYEIWLVKNYKEIITIKDFFRNPIFKEAKTASEYRIYLRDEGTYMNTVYNK